VDLLEAVRDLAEALRQARLQRRVQLLVDGLAHLFQAPRVVVLQVADLGLERGAHFEHALGVRLGQRTQRAVHGVGEALERARLLLAAARRMQLDLLAHGFQLLRRGCLVLGQVGRQFLARGLGAGLHLVAQLALHALEGLGRALAVARGAGAREQGELQADHGQEPDREDDEFDGGHVSAGSQCGLLRIQSAVW
jgi:hypothetical protein